MNKQQLSSITGLLLFILAVQALAGSNSPGIPKTASKVEKTASLERSGSGSPGSCRLFRKACNAAGIKLKQCLRNLATYFIDSDTQSITSDDYASQEGINDGIALLSPAQIIEATLRKSCNPSSSDEVTQAVENIENALSELSNRGIKPGNLEHKTRRDFLRLFRIWFQLPPIQEGQQHTPEKIKMWLTQWPDNIWLDYGMDILVDMLEHVYQLDSSTDRGLPGYYETWLSDTLKYIGSPQAQEAIKLMVRASADPQQQEFLLREAILTGYSHPLPYLRLIDHLVSAGHYEQAKHIYEMYRLAVLFNTHWCSTNPDKKGNDYWREREVYRLQELYQVAINRLRSQQEMWSENHYPDREQLHASLGHWPEATRSRAEDMLFIKGLEVKWSALERAVIFSESVIERSLERWHNEGKLLAMAGAVHRFIKNTDAPRRFVTLHSRLATMLVRLGHEKVAIDLLYGFVDGYKDGLSTEYDLSLYLIASAHKLNHQGRPVEVPAYAHTLELVRRILASGQREALEERLISIRNGAADLASLQQVFNSIPKELTQLKPGSSMGSFFEYSLQRALEEARDRGIYTGEMPSISDLTKLHGTLYQSRKFGVLLSQFSSAFRHADIETVTELYLEALVSLNWQDISDGQATSEEFLALQWMSLSHLLAARYPDIQPLNSLDQALAEAPKNWPEWNKMWTFLRSERDDRQATSNEILSMKKHKRIRVAAVAKLPVPTSEPVDDAASSGESGKFCSSSTLSPPIGSFDRLAFDRLAFDGNRILHLVPEDGLCLYHSLAVMYGLDKKSFITKILEYLRRIQAVIQTNLGLNQHPYEGLTPAQTQAVIAIMTTELSPHDVSIDELQFQINSLNAALTQISTGENQGTDSWASLSLLNTVAVVLNEHFNINGSLFVLHTNGDGQTVHEFHSDGHSSTHTDLPGNEHPFLVFNQETSHFMPVTAGAAQETTLAQAIRMLQNIRLHDDFKKKTTDQQLNELQRQMNLLTIKFSSVVRGINDIRPSGIEEILNSPFLY